MGQHGPGAQFARAGSQSQIKISMFSRPGRQSEDSYLFLKKFPRFIMGTRQWTGKSSGLRCSGGYILYRLVISSLNNYLVQECQDVDL